MIICELEIQKYFGKNFKTPFSQKKISSGEASGQGA